MPNMFKLILAAVLASAAFASPAEARHKHRPDRYMHRNSSVIVTPWGMAWFNNRPSRVRLSKHCVWKPWNNRTVCRY